jgi:hypothetical protein
MEVLMQKKILVAVLILFVALSSSFAAGKKLTAIGVFGSYAGSTGYTGGGLGLSLKMGSFPVLGLQYNVGGSGSLALSCDYYLVDTEALGGPLTWFLGVGAFGGLSFGSSGSFDFGLRAPIGLQLWPIKKCEIYLAAVPVLHFLPSPNLGLGGELGFRIHL